jgi:hypothetical protein
MRLLQVPDHARALPDEGLGRWLLDAFVVTQAAEHAIPTEKISPEYFESVRQYILTIETDEANAVAVEKALHKAAQGAFQTAGKLLREYLNEGAIAHKYIPIGINRSKQAAKFGKKGSSANKEEGDANRRAVLAAAKSILAERASKPSYRQLAGLIEKKTGISVDTVRGHLTKLRKDKILD